MICHKCNKDGEFYYYKGQICRPCKECKKEYKKRYYHRERELNRILQRTESFKEYRRKYRKVEAKELRLQYIKKLLNRKEKINPIPEMVELKRTLINHLRWTKHKQKKG